MANSKRAGGGMLSLHAQLCHDLGYTVVMSANTSGVDKSAGWVISMLICGWWWAYSAYAAPLLVERVGLERGLSQLSITASLQDSRGFWWFGTQAGLNRYNGYAFRVFRRDFSEETRSIPDDYITALMEADDGRIYIGTGSRGMAIFDPLTEQFAHIHSGTDTTSQLSNGQVLDLAQGPAGFIWIATDGGGLNRLDPATGIVTRIRHDATDPTSILSDQVTEVFFDDQKRLWVGSKLGLQVLENGEFRPVPLASSGPVYVTALIPGPEDSLWVGTTTGLFAVDPQGNIRSFMHDATSTESLAHNHVETLHTDRNGFLWIGTRNGLSRLIDPQAGRFETHRTDAFNIKSLSGSRVSSILEDRHGLLWFGTWVGGLSVYNPNAVGFQVYRYNGEEPSIPDNRVRSFAQSSDGSVWIATLGGLVRFDPGNSHFSDVYQYEPANANSLSSSEIHAVVVDEQDHIWVGTRNAGLNRIDPATGEVDAYRYRDDDSSSIGSDQILTLKIASDGRIWIGFEDRGISIFDPASRKHLSIIDASRVCSPIP